MKIRTALGALLASVLVVCSTSALAAGATNARVMTRNLYIGADVFAAINVPPDQIPAAAGEVLAEILASDFPARARVLAKEIAEKQPHAVGLQEVWSVQAEDLNGLAPDISLDFLAILMDELEARGQKYDVAVANTNVFVPALPALIPGVGLYLGQILDRDVILVRHNVAWANPAMGTYPTIIDLPDPPFNFDIVRGWTSVDLVFGGNPYRFVNTHLEVESFGAGCIQTLQAIDLQFALGGLAFQFGPLPEVVVGDFNSDPDDPGCAPAGGASPYSIMLSQGFTDAWTLRNNDRRSDGDTCCYTALAQDDDDGVTRRVDLIWIRGTDANGVTVRLSGDNPKRQTPDGLYGSDHLGVMARMTLVPAY